MTSLKIQLSDLLETKSDYLIPSNSDLFRKIITKFCSFQREKTITKVVAVDMKGLMYGPAVALKLKKPFVPILKGNKIKNRDSVVQSQPFKDYSGNLKSIELFKNSIIPGDTVLLIDDWFESGETGKACVELIEKCGAKIVSISVIQNQLNQADELFFAKYGFTFIVRRKPRL